MKNFLIKNRLWIFIWAFNLAGFCMISRGAAETDMTVTAERTMRSDGDGRYPIAVSVGSTTAVDPLRNSLWLWDKRRLRSISIINPSSVELYIGTWSGFEQNAQGWTVPKNSGTWTTWNHATFYMLLGNNASSVTVRGIVEYDVQVNISSPNQKP